MKPLAFMSSPNAQRHHSQPCLRRTFPPATARLWTRRMCNSPTLELQSTNSEPAHSLPQQVLNVEHQDQVLHQIQAQAHLPLGRLCLGHRVHLMLLDLAQLGQVDHLGLGQQVQHLLPTVLLLHQLRWLLLLLLQLLPLQWSPQHQALRLRP